MGGISKRDKILLAILGIVVIGFLYYRFALTPQLNKLKAAETTLNDSKAKLENLKVQEKRIEVVKKEVADLTIKANEAMKVVPDTSKIPELIVYLRDMTTASGCTPGNLGFAAPTTVNLNSNGSQGQNAQAGQQGGQQTSGQQNTQSQPNTQQSTQTNAINSGVVMILPISYEVKGGYGNIMSILTQIESCTRKMIVDKITINKDATAKTPAETMTVTTSNLYRRTGDPTEPIQYPFNNVSLGKADLFN
jgi:Tfp pilus assembly protein PilO